MKYLGVVAIAILLSLSSNRFWVQAKPEMCQQAPSMVGMAQDGAACMAFMPAWTYDASKNACSEFVFGGCGGNSNQFSSRDECEKACKD
nr:male accessory gland serine protease inhibitor [Drosophila suzukii]